MNAPPSYRPAGTLPATPLAPYEGPWNERLAAHLLRRAGFGGSPAEIAQAARGSMRETVDALLAAQPAPVAPPALIDDERPAPRDPNAGAASSMFGFGRSPFPARPMPAPADPNDPAAQAKLMARRQMRRDQAAANTLWWLDRMLATTAPLHEKMTLFLHGHFATADNAKGIYGLDIVQQNELLRRFALGNFRNLVHEISRDPAMLKWLDNARSAKAHPNENYARELMELFTLGIGNYTEQDVRESARAFTGWSVDRYSNAFVFDPRRHDDGQKTFLGRSGNLNGDDVVDTIMAQPAASRYLATKLLDFFVYNDPEPALVEQVAALVRAHTFELRPVMSAILRSRVFYDERTYRALVKSPVEFVVGTYRLFGVTQASPETIGVLGRMGQVPFHPPSVKGWDGGAQWLNTQTVLARENFVSSLMGAPDLMQYGSWLTKGVPSSSAEAAHTLVATILQGDAGVASVARLRAYLDGGESAANQTFSGENADERMRGAAYLTMAMPAYQLS